MSLQEEHIAKAEANERLLQPLFDIADAKGEFYDWYITVCFYSAVHWIRAFLAHHSVGTAPRRAGTVHYGDFGLHIERICDPKSIQFDETLSAFEDLKDMSQSARYHTESADYYRRTYQEAEANMDIVRRWVKRQLEL